MNSEVEITLKEVRSCYFQSYKFFLTSAKDQFQYPDMRFKKNWGSPTFFAHFRLPFLDIYIGNMTGKKLPFLSPDPENVKKCLFS